MYNANAGFLPAFSSSMYLDSTSQNAFHGSNISAQIKFIVKIMFSFQISSVKLRIFNGATAWTGVLQLSASGRRQ